MSTFELEADLGHITGHGKDPVEGMHARDEAQWQIGYLRDENAALRESLRQYGHLVKVWASATDKLLDLADDMLHVVDEFYGCDGPCPHSSDCRERCLFETRLQTIRAEVKE